MWQIALIFWKIFLPWKQLNLSAKILMISFISVEISLYTKYYKNIIWFLDYFWSYRCLKQTLVYSDFLTQNLLVTVTTSPGMQVLVEFN